MHLCLLLLTGDREVAIVITNQRTDFPAIDRVGRETDLEAAQRIGQIAPRPDILVSKTWSLEQILAAFALVGLTPKPAIIDGECEGMTIEDCLRQFRALTTFDAARALMQKLLVRGEWRLITPNPGRERFMLRWVFRPVVPPLHGGAEPHGMDGDALFVG